jgi:sortase B
MVQSLMVNEQTLQTNRAQLAELAGVDPNATAAGLELLPAGQTYAPTASPLPARTPTPEPRVAQNDPLIGVLDKGGVTTAADQTAQPTAAQATRTRLTSYLDNPLLSVSDDFTALRQQNGDVVGRLVIDGVLDETLVQRNNTYYLTHNARGTLGNGGAVFVDESILLKKPPENLLIRGQASQPGKLLAPLAQFGTAGEDFLRKHGLITCQTIYEKAEYVVFAVVHADSNPNSAGYFNYAGYPTFQTDAQMMDYVKAAQTASLYPIGVSVKASDRLLTIATLPENGDTQSWVVLCRMLRNGEDASHIQTE